MRQLLPISPRVFHSFPLDHLVKLAPLLYSIREYIYPGQNDRLSNGSVLSDELCKYNYICISLWILSNVTFSCHLYFLYFQFYYYLFLLTANWCCVRMRKMDLSRSNFFFFILNNIYVCNECINGSDMWNGQTSYRSYTYVVSSCDDPELKFEHAYIYHVSCVSCKRGSPTNRITALFLGTIYSANNCDSRNDWSNTRRRLLIIILY